MAMLNVLRKDWFRVLEEEISRLRSTYGVTAGKEQ
jgi:hypothetical protein